MLAALAADLTKESAFDGQFHCVDEAFERDAARRERLLASADYVEGPKAFAEKRKPRVDRALVEQAPTRASRLRALLSPRSVVLVGASDRSGWSAGSFANFDVLGFDGALHLVNRNGGEVHGRPGVTRAAREIGEPVDLALMLVGAGALPEALEDAAAAGIRSAVVLAAGFGETGADGAAAQRGARPSAAASSTSICHRPELPRVRQRRRPGARVVRADDARSSTGSVAVVSQSGATAHTIATFAATQNIGLSHVVSTGNEAMVDTIDMAAAVLEDDRVRARRDVRRVDPRASSGSGGSRRARPSWRSRS